MPRQLSCRGLCKFVTWSDYHDAGNGLKDPTAPTNTLRRSGHPYPHNRIQWEYNELSGENMGPFKGQQASTSNPVMNGQTWSKKFYEILIMCSLKLWNGSKVLIANTSWICAIISSQLMHAYLSDGALPPLSIIQELDTLRVISRYPWRIQRTSGVIIDVALGFTVHVSIWTK